MMKGIKEYLEKHGYHFTKELACKISSSKWDANDILDTAQDIVYYNVTSATSGDMIYLTNWLYKNTDWPEAHDKRSSVKTMLCIVGDLELAPDYFFYDWLWNQAIGNSEFDFTPYI